ncbi:MAG: helix-turn-helix domain-containing protein [bacterium]
MKFRLKALMTQSELAEKSGISRRTITSIERGTDPSNLVKYKLANFFGVEPEDIFPEEKESEKK